MVISRRASTSRGLFTVPPANTCIFAIAGRYLPTLSSSFSFPSSCRIITATLEMTFDIE